MAKSYIFDMYNALNIYWINDGCNPTFLSAPVAPLEMEDEMAPYTHLAPVRSCDSGTSSPMALSRTIRFAGHAIRRFADAFSESCRRIRAYNELANLTPRALQDIGRRRDELDGVIAGEAPRSGRRNQAPVL